MGFLQPVTKRGLVHTLVLGPTLRPEEEFWVWIRLNLVLLVCSENTLLDSLDLWTNHRK